MTFLELVQRLADEADVVRPSAVTNQIGEARRLVNWTISACRDICKKHRNWKFLRSSFTVDTIAGTQAYLVTDCTDNDALSAVMTRAGFLQWWKGTFWIYRQSDGVATQRRLPELGYDDFRERWLIGAPASGPPNMWTERPRDLAIMLGAKPDAVYVVTGDYQRLAPDLAANDDEPLFPAAFHELIVWEALPKYMGFEEDGGGYDHANRERRRLWTDLELDQLPAMGTAPPLC